MFAPGFGGYSPSYSYGGFGSSPYGFPSAPAPFYSPYSAGYRSSYAPFAVGQQFARRSPYGMPAYTPAYAPRPAYAPPPAYASSPWAPSFPYTTPVTSYVPPVSSFAPATSFSAYSTTPAFGAFPSYGNYASPVTFGARTYGAYTPYSPYGSNFFGATFPYSAYGGLEKPLDLPTLALPAPPVSLFTGATTLPSLGYGTAFPLTTAVSEVVDVPVDAAPADAPIEEASHFYEHVTQEQVPQEEVVVAEAVAPEQKNPWGPGQGDEEFDLEYSRQVASRRVIGEEEE